VCASALRQTRRKEEEEGRLRRMNYVKLELRNMGVKSWRTKVLGRIEWTSVVRETKAKLEGFSDEEEEEEEENAQGSAIHPLCNTAI
jgi:hypothetical protein